jgi:hypothetical protein
MDLKGTGVEGRARRFIADVEKIVSAGFAFMALRMV